jgi:hypothetical protein
MHHDNPPNHSRADSPAGLVHVAQLLLLVHKLRVEGDCKVGSKVVAGAGLRYGAEKQQKGASVDLGSSCCSSTNCMLKATAKMVWTLWLVPTCSKVQ